MAIKLALGKGNIEVIGRKDSAIGPEGSYEAYQDSFSAQSVRGNEELLHLDGEPTRFVLRKNLPYEGTLTVKDRQMTFENGKPKVQFSYTLEEIRYALVDIKNPADVPLEDQIKFVKDESGYADRELVAALDQAGILMDLFAARQKATSEASQELKKK